MPKISPCSGGCLALKYINERRIRHYLQDLCGIVAYFASTLGQYRDDYCRFAFDICCNGVYDLSLIHISEPTRLGMISYAVFCLKKKKTYTKKTKKNKINSKKEENNEE